MSDRDSGSSTGDTVISEITAITTDPDITTAKLTVGDTLPSFTGSSYTYTAGSVSASDSEFIGTFWYKGTTAPENYVTRGSTVEDGTNYYFTFGIKPPTDKSFDVDNLKLPTGWAFSPKIASYYDEIYVYYNVPVEASSSTGYTITLDPNYTGAATSTATANEEGKLTEAQLAAPTRTDYVFMGWFDAATGGNEVTADTVFDDDTTIYAQWAYCKLSNDIYTALDESKKQDIVDDMIDGETYDSVDLSGLFTLEENANCLTFSAVLSDVYLNTSGTYEAFKKYYAFVTIKPKTGFIFQNINDTKLFIGAKSYLPYKVDTANNSIQFLFYIGSADYTYEDVIVDEVQVNVDTSKLDLIANEAIDPEAVYSCFSVPDEVEYDVYLSNIAYKDDEGNYNYADLDNGDTYIGGKEYYANLAIALPVELSVIYIYSFADDVTITFGDGSIPFEVNDRGEFWITGYYPLGTVSDPIGAAAEAIDSALDDLKPTNDTTKDDVKKIVNKKNGDTTATVTTFELTPATTEEEGSLKVIVTISYGSNEQTVTKTYTIDKLPAVIEEGDIIIDNSNNFSGAGIANASEAKNYIPITDEEKTAIESGENIYIILDVKDGTDTVPTTDKTVIRTIAGENGLIVGTMLDIELFKRIGDGGLITAVHETNGMITVEFNMPAALINTDSTVTRTYKVIRVHNGVATVLDCDFDPVTGKASFKTDKFSSYAIVYVDTANAEPENPATTYPLDLGTDGRVHSNATAAAAGDVVTIAVDPGYIAHVISGNTEIAKIIGSGTFVMPANGVKIVVECELGGYMLTKARSYVYSYDSGMNYITVNSTKNQKNTVTVNLGKDYAGKSFVIYEGKKSTKVKVTDGTLDANGKFTLEIDYGKNYTLVVED
ncbi:MAG: InlB B-repeat-containing protein [Oscillospiraceae bacterium]